MKFAVYAICKNEAHNFENWWNQVKGADFIYVLDTGSTDGTLDLLQEKYEQGLLHYNHYDDPHSRAPKRIFRFDHARNMALDGVAWVAPQDIEYFCWSDFDESYTENWCDAVRLTLTNHRPSCVQFMYDFGTTQFYQTRVHDKSFKWHYPAHEVLLSSHDELKEAVLPNVFITQPDKERRDCTALLELGYKENPESQRAAYYLGREYWYEGRNVDAKVMLYKAIELQGWVAEKGQAFYMLSNIAAQEGDLTEQERCLHLFLSYCNLQREPYMELCKFHYSLNDFFGAIHWASRALELNMPTSYLTLDNANYTHAPHDYLMASYDKIGLQKEAAHQCAMCLHHLPNEERYRKNLQYFINQGVLNVQQDTQADSETGDGEGAGVPN